VLQTHPTNLGVRSSNLFGRASLLEHAVAAGKRPVMRRAVPVHTTSNSKSAIAYL